MTAAVRDMHGLPNWPRGLSREQAAAYVGVSATAFAVQVEEGIWPKGVRVKGRVLWDRLALDRAFDDLSGSRLGSTSSIVEGAGRWAKSA